MADVRRGRWRRPAPSRRSRARPWLSTPSSRGRAVAPRWLGSAALSVRRPGCSVRAPAKKAAGGVDGMAGFLAIPDKFEKYFRGLIANSVKIESRCGHTYVVEVAKNLGKVVLRTGWKEFVTAHDLNMGDFLVFKYDGTSRLKVFIFDLSCCEKMPPCLVKRNHICGRETREMHNEISSSCGHLPMNVTASSSTSQSDLSGDSICPKDQKSRCVPGYILPRGTCLTYVQMRKLKERVQASSSWIPIYGCIIKQGNIHGRSQAMDISRVYADVYLPFEDQTLMLQCRGKSWQVRCVIKEDTNRVKRLMKGWKQFACENKLRLGDLCLFELLSNVKYTMNVHVIRAK